MNTTISDFHAYSESILQDVISLFLNVDDPKAQLIIKQFIQLRLYFHLCQMSASREVTQQSWLFQSLPLQQQLDYWAERVDTYYQAILRSEVIQNSFAVLLNYYMCWLY